MNNHEATYDQPVPLPLPPSPLYELINTPSSGRGVYATTSVPANTLLLNTLVHSDLTTNSTTVTVTDNDTSSCNNKISQPLIPTRFPLSSSAVTAPALPSSPLAHLIQRPYRKEVCAHCFAYDRGREWKVKPSRECGVVYCSVECLELWTEWNGPLGGAAWEALERGVREGSRRNASRDRDGIVAEADGAGGGERNHVGDGNGNDNVDEESCNDPDTGPTEVEVAREWESAQRVADVVLNVRRKKKSSKNEKKVLQIVLENGGDPDLMYYILTAVISAYNADMAQKGSPTLVATKQNDEPRSASTPSPTQSTDASSKLATPSPPPPPNISRLLQPLFTLTSSPTAYKPTHTSLHLYTASHLFLLHLLPLSLTPYLSPLLSHNLNTRAAHNAFSIRPPASQDGADSGEFLGWGVWPEGSFFNHSCEPNVGKVRKGRGWEFYTLRDVKSADELCITYLGGDEGTMGVSERRARLRGEWGFECGCGKCVREDGEGEETR